MENKGRKQKQQSLPQTGERQLEFGDQFNQALSETIHLMKSGQFDDIMGEKVRNLEEIVKKFGPKLQTLDEARYYNSFCVISEYYDHRGRYEESYAAVARGESVYLELQKRFGQPISLEERRLLREKVRYVANYAMAKHYRVHEYDEARKIVGFCFRLVSEKLRDKESFPSAGTLAQLMEYLGRINRQDHNHQVAMINFDDAIKFFYERGEYRKFHQDQDNEKRLEEWNFIRHRTAICLALGLGWVCYTRGQLRQALHFILPARVFLLHSHDPINAATIDLTYGATRRALGNIDEETIKLITNARVTFERMGHKLYWVWAACELALACLISGDHKRAESALGEIDSLLTEDPDDRWHCNALIVHSRLEREMKKDYISAEAYASEAYNKADQKKLILCKIDALIARSEARIKMGNLKMARKDLKEALELNRQSGSDRKGEGASPKIEAVCHLHLAYSYTQEDEGKKAERHLQRWKALQVEIEHDFIHKLAVKVEQEIENLDISFEIRSDAMDLKYEKWERKLQRFLVKKAKLRKQDKEQQRELLGVSRPTFLKWEKVKEKD